MLKFLGDVIKPILTLLFTVFGIAFIASILSPQAGALFEKWVPAWSIMDPALAVVRDWLGLGPEAPRGWWHFWGRD